VIRLAELYLTRAIIQYMDGNLAGAAGDLNTVRARAWDASVAGSDYAASDQYLDASTITAEIIHIERIKELAYEGDRLSYLQALGLPIPAGERDGVDEVPSPYVGMYWTIPQNEVDFRLD
jgi:hypothetical protein